MLGPNGKISKVVQDHSGHICDLLSDVSIAHIFKCAWCHGELKMYGVSDAEEAAEDAHNHNGWATAQDDVQIGLCCRSCLAGTK